MSKKTSNPDSSASLPKNAEDLFTQKTSAGLASQSEAELRKLVQVLQAKQTMLESRIEELQSVNQEFEQEKAQLSSLFDFAPSACFTLNKNGEIEELNHAGATMLGQEKSLLIRSSFKEFVADESLPVFNEFVEALSKGVSPQSCDLELKNCVEPCFWTCLAGTLSGDQKNILLNVSDITRWKKAENALKESEFFACAIANSTPALLYLYDFVKGENIWTNDMHRQFFGEINDINRALQFNDIVKLIHPDDIQVSVVNMEVPDNQKSIELRDTEIRIKFKDTWKWMRHQVKVFKTDDTGKPLQILGALFDIDTHKKDSEELKLRNTDLQLMRLINEAANTNDDLLSIIDLISRQLNRMFNSHLLSVFLADDERRELKMFGNTLNEDLVKKIEKLTGKPIPSIVLDMDAENPFTEIGKSRSGLLSVGKKAVARRLAGYLKGTSWSTTVQLFVRKLLPIIADIIGYQSMAAVPMISKGRIVGFLELGSKDTMTGRDLTRIQSIADHFATIIVKAEAERKLRESEERLSSAFNYSAIGMAFISTHGRWLKVNQAVHEMLGYSEADLLTEMHQDYTHPDDLQKESDQLQQMLQGKIRTFQLEKRYLHKTGKIIQALVSASLVYDHEEKPMHFIYQIQDISRQKQAQDIIRESERKFRSLFENMAQGVIYQDLTGMVTHANPAAEKILGLSLAQMQGKDPTPVLWYSIHEDGTPFPRETHPAMIALKTSKENSAVMGIYNPGEEKVRWITVNAIPEFRKGEEKPYQAFTTFEDITVLKNAFNELNNTKDLLEYKVDERTKELKEIYTFQKAVLDNAPIAIITIGTDGIIKTINPTGELMSGYKAEEIIGLMTPVSFHDTDEIKEFCYKKTGKTNLQKHEVREILIDYMKGSTTEWTWIGKDGQKKFVRIMLSSIIDGHETFQGYIGLVTDITSERKALESLRESEERFHSMFYNHAAVMLLVNPETGEILETNKAAEKYYGLPLNRESKLLISDINILTLEEVKKEIKIALSQERNCFNFKHRTASDEIRSVEVHSTPIMIKGEQVLFSIIHDIHERQQAENALMKSEAENRAIIDAVPDLMFRLKRDGTLLDCHTKTASSLYAPKEKLIGEKISSILPPGLVEKSMEVIEKAFETGQVEQFEYSLFVNNENNHYENRIIAISDDEVISIIREISDRKKAEVELQEALQKLSTLIQNLQAGTLFENEYRKITLVNQSFCNIFNIPATPEQMIGYDCATASEQSKTMMKDPDGFLHRIDEVLNIGDVVLNDELYLNDGRVLERDYIPIRQNSTLLGHLWQYRDITTRKASEAALRMQSAAFESFALPIIITDKEGHIQWVNPAFSKLTGYSTREAIGRTPGELLKSGKHDKQFYDQIWETIRSKKVWSGELINRRKDGSFYFEEETITPVLDSQGEISSFIAIKIDISERKKLYQELADEKRRLDDIIKGTNSGTWEWNIRTSETTFNRQWAEMIGYTLEEISPTTIETWMNFAHPDDLKLSGELLEKHFRGETDYYMCETRMKHKNGEWIWVLDKGRVHMWDKDGKPVLMSGTHQEITDRKRASEFEGELLQQSLQLTGIPASEIEPALNMALGRIGSFLNADRAYIFELNAEGDTMSNTYEWCNEGINSEIDKLKDLPCEIFPKWMETLKQQENILIPSVKDLTDEWQTEREILEPQGIQSLVIIPLLLDNTLIGFVGLDSVLNSKEYKESEINILKVWGNMLAGLINYQRKESYIALMRQNYETFFNTIDDFLFVLDSQGKMIHINNTVNKRLGYNSDELLGNTVLMVHPENRRDEAGRIVGEMLTGMADFCPVPLVTRSGEYIPVETRVKHGFWDGKPVIFGVSKDISKIKLSEEKFSKAFQSNSAMMAISAPDGTFMEVNDTFILKLGFEREEIIGKNAIDLNLFENPAMQSVLTNLLVRKSSVRDIELRIKTKSGNEITGLFSGELITIGEKKSLLTMLVDISERKLAEAEILKAKSEAEKANLAKSEFLSRMSHELRTPMNSILGFAQLMEMGPLSPKQQKGVSHILNNGEHLLALINEVLDISGIEAGRQALTLEPLQLAPILKELIDTIQVAAGKREITVSIADTQANDLYALSDRLRLKQVLINLLNNAVKYNKTGGKITVTTSLEQRNELEKMQVRISITDTGNGIKPEDIGKLFQPFERIGADKTETEGTGLGLMVVKKLTEAMGGKVGVHSILNEGTTFWIELQLAERSDCTEIQKRDTHVQAAPTITKDNTVLYIEDNRSNIELVEAILSEHRPNVRLVTSMFGKQTLELIREHKPAMVLLDLDLPDVQGLEVLQELMTTDSVKNTPVIIISADAMPFQIEKLMGAGAVAYITKPLDVFQFMKTIDQHIKV